MNGATIASAGAAQTVGAPWRIEGVGDHDRVHWP